MKKIADLLRGTFSPEKTLTGNMSSVDFLKLIDQWQVLVSGFVAENTVPYRLKGKELHIATLHPTLAQELSFMEQDVLLKILQHYPAWTKKIERLNFRYFPGFDVNAHLKNLRAESMLTPSKQVAVDSVAPNLTQEQKKNLKNNSLIIDDEDIRKLLNSLIEKL